MEKSSPQVDHPVDRNDEKTTPRNLDKPTGDNNKTDAERVKVAFNKEVRERRSKW